MRSPRRPLRPTRRSSRRATRARPSTSCARRAISPDLPRRISRLLFPHRPPRISPDLPPISLHGEVKCTPDLPRSPHRHHLHRHLLLSHHHLLLLHHHLLLTLLLLLSHHLLHLHFLLLLLLPQGEVKCTAKRSKEEVSRRLKRSDFFGELARPPVQRALHPLRRRRPVCLPGASEGPGRFHPPRRAPRPGLEACPGLGGAPHHAPEMTSYRSPSSPPGAAFL